jgi:hypothetical protein
MANENITKALQSILEKVGDAGLNEGDFLTMNNLLKKTFESNVATVLRPLNIYIKLSDCIHKKDITIKYLNTNHSNKTTIPAESWVVNVSVDGKAPVEVGLCGTYLFTHLMLRVRLYRPKKIIFSINDEFVVYNYHSIMDHKKQEDVLEDEYKNNADDADDEYVDRCYDYISVMNCFIDNLDDLLKISIRE